MSKVIPWYVTASFIYTERVCEPVPASFRCTIALEYCPECACELVRAACALASAPYPFKAGHRVRHLHAPDKGANALGVAGAPSGKGRFEDNPVLHGEGYLLGADIPARLCVHDTDAVLSLIFQNRDIVCHSVFVLTNPYCIIPGRLQVPDVVSLRFCFWRTALKSCLLIISIDKDLFDLHYIDGMETIRCAVPSFNDGPVDEVRICHLRLEELAALEGQARLGEGHGS